MFGEFRGFLQKHNVVGLAVAVVIGGAVSKLVASVVADLIMPVLGLVTPTGNWREAVLDLGGIKFGVGNFIGSLIDFIIIAAVVFLIVKTLVKEEPAKK